MAKDRDKKSKPAGGVPAPPPASRARLPSRLRDRSASEPAQPAAPSIDPLDQPRAVVGPPSIVAPPSHRHMSTMGYRDIAAPLPFVPDANNVPDRLRQTSLPIRPTMSAALAHLPGVALAQIIDAAALDADACVALLIKVCEAVQVHHSAHKGVGRLTPRHVRLVPNATGKVALLTGDEVPADPGYDVLYESPEAGGLIEVRKRAAEREDVYALGCIGFEIFTGRAPFVGASPADIRNRRARFAVPAARQVAADAELLPSVEVEIQKALKTRSGDRHADAGELADGLRAANATDDRSTMALGAEQAELLQELLAGKTANVQAAKALEEEKKRFERERQRAEEARVQAAERAAGAAHVATEVTGSKSKAGIVIGALALVLVGAGVVAFALWGRNPEPIAVTAGAVDPAEPDTAVTDIGEVDTGASDTGASDTGASDTGASDTGASDTGASDTGEADTGEADAGVVDTGAKPKARPRRRPKSRHRPKPKPTRPTGGPVVF